MRKIRTELEVPEELLEEFESAIKGHYANRSEALRDSMRLLITKLSEGKVKISQSEILGGIKELIIRYKTYEKWAELDVLRQLSEILIHDSHIAENVNIRYDVDGVDVLNQVREDLLNTGVEDVSRFSDVIKHYFEESCEDAFKKRLKKKIGESPKKIKDALKIISHYESIHDSKGPLTACSLTTKLNEKEIERELIKMGVIDLYLYSSIAFTFPAWNLPKYSQSILRVIREKPETYRISKPDRSILAQLLKEDRYKEFVKWVKEKGPQTVYSLSSYILESEFEKERQKINSTYGEEAFENVIGKLIKTEGLYLRYLPSRSRAGKRESRPAEYVFQLAPELIEAY